jgi:hypothetical protein
MRIRPQRYLARRQWLSNVWAACLHSANEIDDQSYDEDRSKNSATKIHRILH